MTGLKTPSEPSLLAEYAATNDAYMHYDNFSWQVGAVLIAGVFVFWGFLVEGDITPKLLVVSATSVSLLMSTWLLYCDHNRQIYLCKLHRMYEIETLLGMEQHSRWIINFKDGKPIYRVFGINGHKLNELIFLTTSLGTLAIGLFKVGFVIPFALPLVITIIVILWVRRNEKAIKKHLRMILSKK